eukprot:4035500-Prymnesium_polylepis.2
MAVQLISHGSGGLCSVKPVNPPGKRFCEATARACKQRGSVRWVCTTEVLQRKRACAEGA